MRVKIKNIFKFFTRLFFTVKSIKFIFEFPRPCSVVIVDNNNSLEIKKLIECRDIQTIGIRGESLNLVVLFHALIKNYCQF